jgi:hypothetical protein
MSTFFVPSVRRLIQADTAEQARALVRAQPHDDVTVVTNRCPVVVRTTAGLRQGIVDGDPQLAAVLFVRLFLGSGAYGARMPVDGHEVIEVSPT